MFNIGKALKKAPQVKLKIEGLYVTMLCDSGASVNIIDEHVYDKLANKVVLRRTREKLYAYGSKSPLPLLGKFQPQLKQSRNI